MFEDVAKTIGFATFPKIMLLVAKDIDFTTCSKTMLLQTMVLQYFRKKRLLNILVLATLVLKLSTVKCFSNLVFEHVANTNKLTNIPQKSVGKIIGFSTIDFDNVNVHTFQQLFLML